MTNSELQAAFERGMIHACQEDKLINKFHHMLKEEAATKKLVLDLIAHRNLTPDQLVLAVHEEYDEAISKAHSVALLAPADRPGPAGPGRGGLSVEQFLVDIPADRIAIMQTLWRQDPIAIPVAQQLAQTPAPLRESKIAGDDATHLLTTPLRTSATPPDDKSIRFRPLQTPPPNPCAPRARGRGRGRAAARAEDADGPVVAVSRLGPSQPQSRSGRHLKPSSIAKRVHDSHK